MWPAITTWMWLSSAVLRRSGLMCMPTMVPTPWSASFSMIGTGPSVPPVMSTHTLPARLPAFSSTTYGPAPLAAATRYSGTSNRARRTSSTSSGSRSSRKRLRKVVTRLSVGVWAEKNGMSSSRAASIAWSTFIGMKRRRTSTRRSSMTDSPTLIGTPQVSQTSACISMTPIELGERHALGVMGVDGVDAAALLAQAVGEQHLADVHVDAGDERGDLGVAVADVDARVDVRVGQLLLVEDRLEVVGKRLVAAPGHGERALDALAAPGIGLDPHADRGLVHLS